ncbi:MAG: hypothetical protein JEZ09_04475 [Salinivirgaceae bacterium]|nr:hypothetical protein [Salinivirgaceae bacterium]
MNKKTLIFIVFLVCILTACKKPIIEQVPVDFDTNYFPMEQNSWKIFDVTFISIDEPTNLHDTLTYQIKEINKGWYVDAVGDSLIIIERYKRDSLNDKWENLGVWQAGIKETKAIQIEENIKYVKMLFPISIGKEWNGNAYNSQDTLNNFLYKYSTLDSVETYNEILFDQVVTVTQKYDSNKIKKISFIEKYQYGVGLIYKEQIDLYSSDVFPGVPVEDRVSVGTFYYQKILNYGTD